MRGVNLLAVAGAQGQGLRWPLEGVRLETLALDGPRDWPAGPERFVACLSGELVLDLPNGEYRHLKPLEAVTVPAGAAARLAPVDTAVLLVVQVEPG